MLIQANSFENFPIKENCKFDAVITSPPYFGQRSYGESIDELGNQNLIGYLACMEAVFTEVSRYLKPDGTVWIVIGDTMSGSGGAGGDHNKGGMHQDKKKYKQGKTGLPDRSRILVPERLAIHLTRFHGGDKSWVLRQKIIWDKGKIKRESLHHAKRPGFQYETILMFAKTGWPDGNNKIKHKFYPDRLKEKGDIWHVNPGQPKGNSPAPYPDELVRRIVDASTEPGDSILDPFAGSDTTSRVARQMGRVGVGLELYGKAFL